MLHAGLVASQMRASFRLIVWDLVKRHARSGTWKQLIACAERTYVFFFRLFRGSEDNLCYPEKRAKKRLFCWLKACCSFACSLAACFALTQWPLEQKTRTILNLLFHWSPLICTSIVFRERGIVMWQSLLFSTLEGRFAPSTSAPGPRDLFKCYHDKKRPLSIFLLRRRESKPRQFCSYHFLYTLS